MNKQIRKALSILMAVLVLGGASAIIASATEYNIVSWPDYPAGQYTMILSGNVAVPGISVGDGGYVYRFPEDTTKVNITVPQYYIVHCDPDYTHVFSGDHENKGKEDGTRYLECRAGAVIQVSSDAITIFYERTNWWDVLLEFIQLILRYLFFGWLWMQ